MSEPINYHCLPVVLSVVQVRWYRQLARAADAAASARQATAKSSALSATESGGVRALIR